MNLHAKYVQILQSLLSNSSASHCMRKCRKRDPNITCTRRGWKGELKTAADVSPLPKKGGVGGPSLAGTAPGFGQGLGRPVEGPGLRGCLGGGETYKTENMLQKESYMHQNACAAHAAAAAHNMMPAEQELHCTCRHTQPPRRPSGPCAFQYGVHQDITYPCLV